MHRRIIAEQFGELMQLLVAQTLCLDRLDGGRHVVASVSRAAVTLPHIADLLR